MKKLVGRKKSVLFYVDHIERQGWAMFEHVCRLDLEGIVAKPKGTVYVAESKQPPPIKIKNPDYSQNEGRQDLFDGSCETTGRVPLNAEPHPRVPSAGRHLIVRISVSDL